MPALRQQAGGAYACYLLRQAIGSKGFDGLGPQLSAIRQQHALPNPDEGDLNAWGYRLLRQQRTSDALAVFKLAVQLYPDSANGHDSLAEAGEAAGDQALAISHYRRSVELDADNRHAIERLKQLEKNEKSPALPQIR